MPGSPESSSPGRPARGSSARSSNAATARYTGEPDQTQLDGYFHLNATDGTWSPEAGTGPA